MLHCMSASKNQIRSAKGVIYKKKFSRRQPDPKKPELVFWVMIIMLLVKFAIVLFGNK